MKISSLPNEVLGMIHDHATREEAAPPHSNGMTAALQHSRMSREQVARREMKLRQNWCLVSKEFHAVDRANLLGKTNGDRGCAATSNAIARLALKPEAEFQVGVRNLLAIHHNIGVDFSKLTPEKARILLKLLIERANSDGTALFNVRFDVDLDHSPPDLVQEIHDTINTLRTSRKGDEPQFEFACSSRDLMLWGVDLTAYPELTSVDFSLCFSMTRTPDFSACPKLTSVNLKGCDNLVDTPDFTHNPELRLVDLSSCDKLVHTPNFTHNPELRSVDLSWCEKMTTTPVFKGNPKLVSVNLAQCIRMRPMPNFRDNPKLSVVNLSGWSQFINAPNFSDNPDLTSVDLSNCDELRRPPVFKDNPHLTSVNLSNCVELRRAPDFTHNPKLRMVDLSACLSLENEPIFSPDHNMENLTVKLPPHIEAVVPRIRSR